VGAGRLLRSPARLRLFNVAMALLLIASIVPLLLD
jgi:threonine/homoserine/homoserine lactone efflux protein